MSKKIVPKSDHNSDAYHIAIANEVLEDLGLAIYNFRSLGENLSSAISQKIPPDVLAMIDSMYQYAFDKIADELANANDLHIADVAISGLDKSIRVRRGFCRKADVL